MQRNQLRMPWGTQCLLLAVAVLTSATYFDALDDSVLNKISWLGPSELEMASEQLNSIVMTTARGEKYSCILPKRQEVTGDDAGPYTGPTPIELLSPLFSQFVCTFKLETYWTYELCHGKYIRQYHEEREGKKVKLQEYFLGRWDKDDIDKMKRKIDDEFNALDKTQMPTKKIDGVNMPYLQINMSDGTLCDLNGQVRNTRILYVCYSHGKHEIYSLEETSTCEYEIVVLSPQLCQHPNFKSKETGENVIGCQPLEGAPKTPKALTELEAESFKIRHEHLLQNLESLLETKIKGDAKPVEGLIDEIDPDFLKPSKPAVHDSSFLSGFLTGKHCLTGGSHWWKFEFCYGKHVLQYHEEADSGSRTEIVLGRWNVEKHKEYLDKNPNKKALTQTAKKNIVHLYTGGDKCDQSGLPRTVEVKYKCVEHPSPSAIAVYLLEPKTCEYTLGVESSLLCPFLRTSDDYGQFDISQLINSLSSSAPISSFTSAEKTGTKNSQSSKSGNTKYKSADHQDIIMMDEDAPPQVA